MYFKLFILSLVICSITAIYEEKINETAEKLKTSLHNHFPLSIPSIKVDREGPLLSINAEAEDILLLGPENFEFKAKKISILPPRFSWELTFPRIQLIVPYYKLDARLLGFFEIYGAGTLNILIKDVKIRVAGRINVQTMQVHHLKIAIDVGSFKSQITGLFHNESASLALSNVLDLIVENIFNNEKVTTLLENILMASINAALSNEGSQTGPEPEPESEPEPQPEPEPEPRTQTLLQSITKPILTVVRDLGKK